ncbi:unnamed protein product [Scytosiphon promiscuus]
MQLDEMELLETAYPEVAFDTPDARPLLRTVLDESLERQRLPDQRTEEHRLGDILASAPLLSFRCPLPHKEAQLRIRLPRLYPDSPLNATVEGTPQLSLSARTAIAEAASDEATRISGERRKEPQCLQVLGEAMRKATDLVDHESAGGQDQPAGGQRGGLNKIPGAGDGGVASSSTGNPLGCTSGGGRRTDDGRHGDASGNSCGGRRASSASAGFSGGESVFLGRRLIYSHHIIATQKRTGIIKGARELRLGGFSKVGWPGVIVVEGEEASCEEFVGMLRGWRWKHLAVRGEETVPIPDGRTLDQQRLLPLPLEELGEKEGVSALAKRCREAGLGDLFSTLLR